MVAILVTKRINEKLSQLSSILYQPLKESLKDEDEIIVSPDGALWLVP
ncbi:MAG: hypothetical protein R3C56_09200 [Pirellulaceae bacterium]